MSANSELGFDEFADHTEANASMDDSEDAKRPDLDQMRWYPAKEGLQKFSEMRARIKAGETWGLDPMVVTLLSITIVDGQEPWFGPAR